MTDILVRLRRNIPLFVAAVAGVFLTFGFTIIGWLTFIAAAIMQDHLLESERDDWYGPQ